MIEQYEDEREPMGWPKALLWAVLAVASALGMWEAWRGISAAVRMLVEATR